VHPDHAVNDRASPDRRDWELALVAVNPSRKPHPIDERAICAVGRDARRFGPWALDFGQPLIVSWRLHAPSIFRIARCMMLSWKCARSIILCSASMT
jgi:hypothetical protein